MTEARNQMAEGGTVTLPAFGVIERERVLAVDELFAVVKDKFPVTPGHTLIIPRRAVLRFAELSAVGKRFLPWNSQGDVHLPGTGCC